MRVEMVFLNGRFLPMKEARLSLLTSGLLYGWGLFESMRAYHNKIIYLDLHLKRIKKSCNLIDMKFPYSLAKLKEAVRKTVEINGLQDAYVRLTLWKGLRHTDTLITARKYTSFSHGEYRKGFKADISSFRQNENSFFARLKTTNYLLYQLSYQQARRRGFDEAVILNSRGYIAEASRSNIFFIHDDEVFTPALECGCLSGITREVIFALARKENIKIHEGNFTIHDLQNSDGAFLTNSLMGVMPLGLLKKHLIADGKVGKLTNFFIRKYNHLLKNGS